jgi:hypothetical protein
LRAFGLSNGAFETLNITKPSSVSPASSTTWTWPSLAFSRIDLIVGPSVVWNIWIWPLVSEFCRCPLSTSGLKFTPSR